MNWTGIEYDLSTHDKLIMFCHCSSIFTISLTLFSFFVIIYKSDHTMQFYKWHLFANQLFTLFMDVFVGFLTIPCTLIPLPIGYTAGALNYIFPGFNYHYVAVFGGPILVCMACSMVQPFIYRFFVMLHLTGKSSFPQRKLVRIIISMYVSLITWTILTVCQLSPLHGDQLLQFAQKIPPLLLLLQRKSTQPIPDVYGSMLYPEQVVWSALVVLVFFSLVGVAAYCTFGTIFLLYRKRHSMSIATREKQKSFFTTLTVQMLFPLFGMILPCAAFGITNMFYIWSLINRLDWTIGLLSCHGVLGSVALLSLYKPYRAYVATLLPCRPPPQRKNTRVQPAETHMHTTVL